LVEFAGNLLGWLVKIESHPHNLKYLRLSISQADDHYYVSKKQQLLPIAPAQSLRGLVVRQANLSITIQYFHLKYH
jgi:hypothetical protein